MTVTRSQAYELKIAARRDVLSSTQICLVSPRILFVILSLHLSSHSILGSLVVLM